MGWGKDKVAQILKAHGIELKEFTRHEKREGKTPDFRIFKSENLAFFCEVKSAQEDSWLDEKFQQSPSIEIVGGLRPDPVFNRLTSHIHKASKQFSVVNPNLIYPNVLAFINFDSMSGFLELIGVITGLALAESGESYPIYLQYSEGRIKDEKFRIQDRLPVASPWSGDVVGEVSRAGPGEWEAAITAAERAAATLRKMSSQERRDLLEALVAGVKACQAELAQIIVAEGGKPITYAGPK